MIQEQGARSILIGCSRSDTRRLVGWLASLFLVFALAVEAIPSPSEDGACESLASPAEELPRFAFSSGTSSRGSLPGPAEPRAGGLQRRPLTAHPAFERYRLAGDRPPPPFWTGHRKRLERRATSASADDAH